jgi:hypothetical protein
MKGVAYFFFFDKAGREFFSETPYSSQEVILIKNNFPKVRS